LKTPEDGKSVNNVPNEVAQLYHQELFKHLETLSYLRKERQLSEHILKDYQIGYSPSSDFLVKNYIRKDGKFSRVERLQAVLELDLLKINGYGENIDPYDFFCGFLTFPIHNPQGKVVGFTSRKFIEAGNRPKFMHVFYEDGILYNEKSLNYEYVVVVESPICALTLEQYGIPSVAVMGIHRIGKTYQKLLGVRDVYIAFDSEDKFVGRAQAEKLASLLLMRGKDSYLVELPLLFEKTDVNSYFALASFPVDSFKFLMSQAKRASSLNLGRISKRKQFKGSTQDIVKIVSEYVSLEERNGRYWGICPFHAGGKEKHASLCVGGKMNIFYCFACSCFGGPKEFVEMISSQ